MVHLMTATWITVVLQELTAGNVNFARAREGMMSSELLGAELEQRLGVVRPPYHAPMRCFPLMEMAGALLSGMPSYTSTVHIIYR